MPCLIVGTQTDLREDASVREKLQKQKMQPVRKEDGERMAKELGAVKYVECSALTQYKLKDVFDEVCAHPSSPLPFRPAPSYTVPAANQDGRLSGNRCSFRATRAQEEVP